VGAAGPVRLSIIAPPCGALDQGNGVLPSPARRQASEDSTRISAVMGPDRSLRRKAPNRVESGSQTSAPEHDLGLAHSDPGCWDAQLVGGMHHGFRPSAQNRWHCAGLQPREIPHPCNTQWRPAHRLEPNAQRPTRSLAHDRIPDPLLCRAESAFFRDYQLEEPARATARRAPSDRQSRHRRHAHED